MAIGSAETCNPENLSKIFYLVGVVLSFWQQVLAMKGRGSSVNLAGSLSFALWEPDDEDLHDLLISVFPGFDLYRTDPAQHTVTTGTSST